MKTVLFAKLIRFLLNPHLLICLGIAWMITNGWSYLFVGIGSFFEIPELSILGTAYLALLWTPFTPEKLITVLIALWLMKHLFPQDQKSMMTLQNLRRSFLKRKKDSL